MTPFDLCCIITKVNYLKENSDFMNEILFTTMLYDFYGELITKKQKEIFELYYLNDFSLNEIATEFNISRQAVLDSIKRTKNSLIQYEEKLSLISKYIKQKECINKIINELENINSSQSLNNKFNNNFNNDFIENLKNNLSSLLD